MPGMKETAFALTRRAFRPQTSSLARSNRIASRPTRQYSSSKDEPVSPSPNSSIEEILSKPTWSVQSLIPPQIPKENFPISAKELHHLLRLSALPPPKDAEEEETMLRTLASQLHFVNAIREVDTTGVDPLAAIRDETESGRRNSEFTLNKLSDVLAKEETVGKHYVRIKRQKEEGIVDEEKPEGWKALDTASKTQGKYFIIQEGKDKEQGS